ncbi:MoxR family ATPase [Candidatus Woesearchaeota archaeon]|nr:MoxR family ATPase [Candidatus Woesearchaeota archaeon]
MGKDDLKHYSHLLDDVREELSKVVVGQSTAVDGCMRAIMANGNVLVEGVPGIAKTLLIRALSIACGCKFSRIQFTVDLLPTDITGITTFSKGNFTVVKGPIFANFVIADEINRASPKTQSALLEAMQEKQVTIGKQTFSLEPPFFVMANNNPIESGGTYPLPEAQIDRFLFKLYMDYPSVEEEKQILKRNITLEKFEKFNLKPILNPARIIRMQEAVKEIHLGDNIEKYIVNLIDATRNPEKYKLKLGKYIEYGCSPRGSIGLFIGSKAEAMMKGNSYVTPQHVKNVAHDVLRHRVLLNYEGQAEGIRTDEIIDEVLSRVPVP